MGPEAAGQRIDRALTDALTAAGHPVSRSRLAKAFADAAVTSAGRALKPSRVVEPPLTVSVVLPVEAPLRAEPEDLPLTVVHEDDDLLVVDKAPGMVVHASAGHERGTLVAAVLYHLGASADDLPVLPGNDATRPGIVHRIDKDTSGLLVIAKHAAAQSALAKQFEAHSIGRTYLGVVVGRPPFASQRIETGHARDPRDRRRFAPTDDAKRRAITTAAVLETFTAAALVRFELRTGRTHQIRMHARHVGHPILGDALYGRPPRDPALRALGDRLGRHALHAATLSFEHPRGNKATFESPLPGDLQDLVDALRGG